MPLRGRLLESVILGYSLIAGAFYSNPPSPAEPEGWLRLTIAVVPGMLALALREHLTTQPERSPGTVIADLLIVYGCVILSQLVAALIWPDVALRRWAPTQGGFVGVMLFTVRRALLPYLSGMSETLPASSIVFADETTATCSRLRTCYGVAGSIALAFGLAGLTANPKQIVIASGWTAIGSAYLLFRAASARERPLEHPRSSVRARCEAMLQGAALWYYGALFPASLVLLHGSKIYLYWIPIVILLFAEANATASSTIAYLPPAHRNRTR